MLCGSIRVPAGAYRLTVFAVMPPGTAIDPDFGLTIEIEHSPTDPAVGANWTRGTSVTATGDAERIPGHLVGESPGVVETDPSVVWDFEPESSPGSGYVGQIDDQPLDQYWIRPRVIVTSGNPYGVLISVVAAAVAQDGAELEFNPATRGI